MCLCKEAGGAVEQVIADVARASDVFNTVSGRRRVLCCSAYDALQRGRAGKQVHVSPDSIPSFVFVIIVQVHYILASCVTTTI
jgi:hypothetical protein